MQRMHSDDQLLIGFETSKGFLPGNDALVARWHIPDYQPANLHPDPLSDAVAWARANPRGWQAIVRWAFMDRANNGRPSIGLYAELLRRPHFASQLGLERSDVAFLINNNLRSGLARLLNREYPELQVPTREARVDTW